VATDSGLRQATLACLDGVEKLRAPCIALKASKARFRGSVAGRQVPPPSRARASCEVLWRNTGLRVRRSSDSPTVSVERDLPFTIASPFGRLPART